MQKEPDQHSDPAAANRDVAPPGGGQSGDVWAIFIACLQVAAPVLIIAIVALLVVTLFFRFVFG